MIEAIFIQNFMRIDQRVQIALSPVTVLVGGNGSGKSSVLKGVHWAVRCATLRDSSHRTTLEQMDYAPSRNFLELAHKKKIQSKQASPKVIVGFIDSNGDETKIQISSARNDAGTKAPISGPLSDQITDHNPKTAYIPGLAGLAESESLLATPILHRRASSGEGGSVLRHILLELADEALEKIEGYSPLPELNRWVSKVFPGVKFWIKFDRLRDAHIEARFLTSDLAEQTASPARHWKPLEMAGTGFLQVVQIFAYLIKFKPFLLLVDEPDAHLHPGTQELLIKTLEEAAQEYNETKFLLTTHSPTLVKACGATTKVHWMSGGKLVEESDETVKYRMGWGALDKELILFTEDEGISHIKELISQWPELSRKVLIWPTFGTGSLPSGDSLARLRRRLKIPVMIHRDRDFMSDNDVALWSQFKGYTNNQISLWVTPGSDIESAFCSDEKISDALGVPIEEAQDIIRMALALHDQNDSEREFTNALNSAIASLPGDQRSVSGPRWRDLGGFCKETIKGKAFLSSIKQAAKQKYINTENSRILGRLDLLTKAQSNKPLCTCLRQTIEQSLRTAPPA